MVNPARRWALAVAALYFRVNQREPALLTGAPPPADVRAGILESLRESWGASSREELLSTLDGLAREGHRKAFNAVARLDPRSIDNDEIRAQAEFAQKHRERIGPRSLLVWDAARAVLLASFGVDVGWLHEDEAWSFILPFAMLVQRTYGSWEEMGKHQLLGREFWGGEWESKFARAWLEELQSPESAWRTLPWSMDLSQHALQAPLRPVQFEPSTPPQPVVVAAPVAKPASSNVGLIVGVIIGVLVLVGAGLGAAFAFGVFDSAPTAPPTAKPAPKPAPTTPAAPPKKK